MNLEVEESNVIMRVASSGLFGYEWTGNDWVVSESSVEEIKGYVADVVTRGYDQYSWEYMEEGLPTSPPVVLAAILAIDY